MTAIMETLQHWAHTCLVWIGFGTLVGLLAKVIMPGKDKVGALTTLLMGIGGTVVGLGVLAYFWEGHHVTPLSVGGFLAATAGAAVLIFFHHLMLGNPKKTILQTRQHAAHTPAVQHTHRTAA